MASKKLEGYSKVAVVTYGSNSRYYFAIYDDGNEYHVGDYVVFSNCSTPSTISEIISPEEACKNFAKNITGEVIGKVDISAYEKRVEARKAKESLRKEMDKRKKEIQNKLSDEYYASKDAEYAELLKRYENME